MVTLIEELARSYGYTPSTKGKVVLSCFDGISCGQVALNRLGIKVDKYMASEVDKFAIQITQKNYPNTLQRGDIRNVTVKEHIDILLGGPPCQDVSFAGKGKGLIEGERSSLFFEFVRVLREAKAINPGLKFLVENTKMKKEYVDIISEILGVEPVLINSNVFSAQNRARLYWTNFDIPEIPEDKGIVMADILEDGFTDRTKSHCIDASYYKGGNLKSYFEKHRRQLVFSDDGLCHIGDADINGHDLLKRVYHRSGKAPTVNTMNGGNREPKVYVEGMKYRKLTCLETERLQTLPDNYTAFVSNTQRYKGIGNGWTVDVICFIMSELKQKEV
tara:strand:- start:231 stop:1226 length:996 start_codon:yes stop_codon:yes gene_type:complete